MGFLVIMAVITTGVTTASAILIGLGKSYFTKKIENIAAKEDALAIAFKTEMGKIEATKKSVEELTQKVEHVKIIFEKSKIQFTKLHERRIVIIEQIYEMVIELNNNLMDYINPFQQSKSGKQENFGAEQLEKQTNTFTAYNKLQQFYHTKKLFFDSSTRQITESLLNIIRSKLWEFTNVERMKSYGVMQKDLMDEYKKRHAASDYLFEETPKLLAALEKELQKTIGVE